MWPNPQETADLVTFTEQILNGKLHFLCSENLFMFNEAKIKNTMPQADILKRNLNNTSTWSISGHHINCPIFLSLEIRISLSIIISSVIWSDPAHFNLSSKFDQKEFLYFAIFLPFFSHRKIALYRNWVNLKKPDWNALDN